MKIFTSWEPQPSVGQFVLRADNVLSNSGKDFYRPAWIERLQAKPMLLVRVNKVAKCVAPHFAWRYYEELGLAISLRATILREGLPIDMQERFDGSLVRWGEWISYEEMREGGYFGIKMLNPQSLEERIELRLPAGEQIDAALSELSHYYLLKMGDYIGLPLSESSWQLRQGEGLFICDGKGQELIYIRIK